MGKKKKINNTVKINSDNLEQYASFWVRLT